MSRVVSIVMLSAAAVMLLLSLSLWESGRPAAAGATADLAWRSEDEQRTIRVYERTNQAVVFISTVTLTVDPFDWFPEIRPQRGSGSGVIIDSQRGLILTNLHVVENAQKIEIAVGTAPNATARLVGADKQYDIAVLQLLDPPPSLVSVAFGDSSQLAVGQRVLAIGNPFGLYRTLTTGIISSLDRTVRSPDQVVMRGLLQTDAAINPGNSGGPLLDNDGRLIGINTAILSSSGDSAGIGFAVPINPIKRILPELISTGRVQRFEPGWILMDTVPGPMVRRVIPGSLAEQAGLQPVEQLVESVFVRGYVRDFNRADLIVSVQGRRVRRADEIEELVAAVPVGSALELLVRRGGLSGPERKVKLSAPR